MEQMEHRFITLLTLLFFLQFITPVIAQNNPFPSPERVQQLLDQIDDCQSILKMHEKELADMEANPSGYSLEEYLEEKKAMKEIKECLDGDRKELEEIRKKYPGWFNQPNLAMPLAQGHEISPSGLEAILRSLEKQAQAYYSRVNKLEKPK